MLVRLYTGDDGQSHFEDLDLDTWPEEWSLELTNAKINFARRGGVRSELKEILGK